MSLICSTTCGTNKPSAQYYNCVNVFRKAGANHFVLMNCAWVPLDITNSVEIAAAVGTDDIHISPPGKLTFQAPTFDTIEIEGCGTTVPGEATYLIDYETYQTKEDLSDCTWMDDLFQNYPSYRIAFVDCNENWKLSTAYVDALKGIAVTVAGNSPGFIFSITTVPHEIEGDGKYVKWVTQFQVKTSRVMCSVKLPGIYAVLA